MLDNLFVDSSHKVILLELLRFLYSYLNICCEMYSTTTTTGIRSIVESKLVSP